MVSGIVISILVWIVGLVCKLNYGRIRLVFSLSSC